VDVTIVMTDVIAGMLSISVMSVGQFWLRSPDGDVEQGGLGDRGEPGIGDEGEVELRVSTTGGLGHAGMEADLEVDRPKAAGAGAGDARCAAAAVDPVAFVTVQPRSPPPLMALAALAGGA
jgi:hypothetical protein